MTFETVTLSLSSDEALVLHDWLSRLNKEAETRFADQAVQRVLWDLEARLERQLVEPFRSDYVARLQVARDRIRDRAG